MVENDLDLDNKSPQESSENNSFPAESKDSAERRQAERPGLPQPAITIEIQKRAMPFIGLVLLVTGLLIGYFGRLFLELRFESPQGVSASESTSSSTGTQPASAEELARQQQLMDLVISRVRHFKGDENAPITLVEFSDFQCPYCGRFAADTEPRIDEQYVVSGQVRFGYVHFAFLGQESQWAAEASECADDQDAFWEYHGLLFESQNGENRGAFNKENLKSLAVNLGLDMGTFNACLDSGKYAELVQQDTAWAQSIGVQSTPTFVLNGQGVIGAQPFEAFEQVIENQLHP